MSQDCPTCGNPIDGAPARCPFCDSPLSGHHAQSARATPAGRFHIVVNLETGRPTVEEALAILERRLDTARRQGVKVVKVIHGYGSSGVGGDIKQAVRRALPQYRSQGLIQDFAAGEEFTKRSAVVRRFPKLKDDRDVGRGNKGVTVVVL